MASAAPEPSSTPGRVGDTVEKTLTLVRKAGAWRIRREASR